MPEWRKSSFCSASECVWVAIGPDSVRMRRSGKVSLDYTKEEWAAFIAGVKAGEFDV